MSTLSSLLVAGARRCTAVAAPNALLPTLSVAATSNNGAFRLVHTGPTGGQLQSEKIKCTMIPGDGVGPELMDSVQAVLKQVGSPVEFETFHLSEVRRNNSIISNMNPR